MTGQYTSPDGTRYIVMRTTKYKRTYYEIAVMRGVGYNLNYNEISEAELKKKINGKELIKCQ